MLKQKISLSFLKLSDADLLTKAQHIASSITGNPAYPDATAMLTELQSINNSYAQALVVAAGLGRNNIAEKNQLRQQLQDVLYRLGSYVLFAANNNTTVLISSGYTLTKDREPTHLASPGLIYVANGNSSGELEVGLQQRTPGASSYLFQTCYEPPTDDTVWISTPSSRIKHTFTNLQPAKQYWFRVVVAGRDGQMAFSNVITQYAQ
ncbi:MAG: hypothetical protein RL172_3051 [Bacteroidota bacterium]|jgi:hypothetical protein